MTKETRYYILVADEKTWITSFTKNIFGFSERNQGNWNTSNVDDLVAFYCTVPIKKIIGFGKISGKFIDDEIFFPDEKLFKRGIYKYRINLENLFLANDWNDGLPRPKNIMMNVGRRVIKKQIFYNLIKSANKKWNLNPSKFIT